MTDELTFETTFRFFPTIIKAIGNGRFIAISTQSANWIVLDSNREVNFLNMLQNGISIGGIVEHIGDNNEEDFITLQKLLAKISARNFAGIEKLPELSNIEGFRMLNLYITNSCNLSCPHCFMNAGVPMDNELSTSQIKKILFDFKTCNGTNVTITGGEPMMRKDLMNILQYAHEIGLSLTVLTNGLLWDLSSIDLTAKIIDEIQISIDGVDDKTNASIRGIGHFSQAIKTAKEFSKRGVRVSIATTFAKEDLNMDIAFKYIVLKSEIEKEAGSNLIFKFSKKLLPGRGKALTNAENEDYSRKVSMIEKIVSPNAKIENFKLGHEPNQLSRNCGIGGISIRADGHVFFCNRVHEVDDYGPVFNRSIAEWLRISAEINETTSVDNVEPCCSCYLKNICNGGCRIDDFTAQGHTLKTTGKWIRKSCSESTKKQLIDKMVEMFDFYYDFSQ